MLSRCGHSKINTQQITGMVLASRFLTILNVHRPIDFKWLLTRVRGMNNDFVVHPVLTAANCIL